MAQKIQHKEGDSLGYELKDIILGSQDGLVNVLGVILAVAAATTSSRLVIIAGLAATFAESISMAAVAYTSTKSLKAYYASELEREKREIKDLPKHEREEIRKIYLKKGFSGTLLNQIVSKITSNKQVWLDTMMIEELKLPPPENERPLRSAAVVGFSALIGSLFPLISFLFLPIKEASFGSIIISIVVLFLLGAAKAKITVGKWWKSGLEIAIIGILAALTGYGIGVLLGAAVV